MKEVEDLFAEISNMGPELINMVLNFQLLYIIYIGFN